MVALLDITGQRFGNLVALYRDGRNSRNEILWVCQCDCGNRFAAKQGALRSGNRKKCPRCTGRQPGRTRDLHGMAHSPEYRIWSLVHDRCMNPRNRTYDRHGGRGIKLCERWMTFRNFYEDMGQRPSSDHSIDRIDNNGNYEPGNCRWATRIEQANNRRSNVLLTFEGRTLTAKQWSRETGLSWETIRKRLKRGWSDEKTLTVPNMRKRT
jgi:hypothetical protein